MNRRTFLRRSAMTGVGLAAAPQTLLARDAGWRSPFQLGVASGDPTADGVVLWTRLAPAPLDGGGMPPIPMLVQWRIADDERMQAVVQHGVAVAWPVFAHAVHIEIRGLQPDRWYFYQFSCGGFDSPIGRTRTLPPPDAEASALRFAFVSCQDWESGLYTAYRNLALEDLDLVVHLGDYIYERGATPTAIRQHDGPEVFSLESYRSRYALYRSDPHLQAAHALCPWLAVPDDHEVDNDYAGFVSEDGAEPRVFMERRANAYRAYYEHMPLRAASIPVGPFAALYRGLTFGTLAEFSALDTRQYRSSQPCGTTFQPRCLGAYSPFRTMTGTVQEQWLLGRLGRSRARWNVVAQQTMFAQFDFLAGRGQIFNMDQWDGYVAARQRITNFLAERTSVNAIVISGDIHSSWVHDIKTDFDDPASPVVGVEFVGTSISSSFPLALVPAIARAVPENPHTRFFDGRYRGYVRCEVTPHYWRADIRAVPAVFTDTADAFTLASFLVVDGQPGAVPA
jgi:alkaline phosphatase D